MSSLLLITLSVAAFAANGTCTRIFQLKLQKNSYDIHLYQFLFCLIASVCFLLSGKNIVLPELPAILYGVSFGVFFCIAVLNWALCYEYGSMSLTGIIINLSLVIPLIYSCIIFHEQITPLQSVGVVLIIITTFLAGLNKEDSKTRTSLKWLILVIIAFFANGITAVLQKQYYISFPDGQGQIFMSVAYFTSALIFLVYYTAKACRKQKAFALRKTAALAGLSALSGIGSFGGNGILAYLSTRVDASVLYPCINGGLCILLAVISFAFFKEKVNAKKVSAIIIGLIAIIILNV